MPLTSRALDQLTLAYTDCWFRLAACRARQLVTSDRCGGKTLQRAWLVPAVATGGAMAFNSLHRVMLSVLAAPILVRAASAYCRAYLQNLRGY